MVITSLLSKFILGDLGYGNHVLQLLGDFGYDRCVHQFLDDFLSWWPRSSF